MINMLVIGFIVMAVFAVACLSLKIRHYGLDVLRVYLNGIIKYIFVSSCFLLTACSGLILCYESISEFLKGILSLESVNGVKLFVRMLTGVNSVFVGLQTVAFASFMVSAVSSFLYLCEKLIVYISQVKLGRSGVVEIKKGKKTKYFSFFFVKTFLAYSKFNS